MQTVQLTEVGDSLGILLPADFMARFDLAAGQTVYLIETQDGFTLTPYPPAEPEGPAAAGA